MADLRLALGALLGLGAIIVFLLDLLGLIEVGAEIAEPVGKASQRLFDGEAEEKRYD